MAKKKKKKATGSADEPRRPGKGGPRPGSGRPKKADKKLVTTVRLSPQVGEFLGRVHGRVLCVPVHITAFSATSQISR